MGVVALFRVCLLLVMTFKAASQRLGKPITCEAGTFVRGQPAAITCNLQAVNATGSGVNLVRYSPGVTDYNPSTTILTCAWQQVKSAHKCRTSKGYESDQTIKDSITVKIVAVSDEYTGLHMCFLVPSDGTDSHACQLILKDASIVSPTTTVRNNEISPYYEGGNVKPWIVTVIVILAVVAIVAVGSAIYFNKKSSSRTPPDDHSSFRLLLLPGGDTRIAVTENIPFEPSKPYPQEQVEKHIRCFRLQDEDLQQIMEILKEELDANEQKRPKANITMFPTILKRLPNGKETGEVLVVNLGSTWLKIRLVTMDSSEFNYRTPIYDITASLRLGTSTQLFDFIAKRIRSFLISINRQEETLALAFLFSFPCKYDNDGGDLTKVRPVRWTKGVTCTGVVNKNLGKRLQQALKNEGCKVVLKAIVNDAVGILVSGLQMNHQCKISFIVGNGVNGCYLQEKVNRKEKVIINTEWGSLGEPTLPERFRTVFDRDLDKLSLNPGEQMLEKMVGRLYIGGVVRLVLLKLIQKRLLFKSYDCILPAFNEKGGFSTEHAMLIQSDRSEDHATIKQVLKQLQVQSSSDHDCEIVKHVCNLVVERAAYLAAAALATIIKHTGHQQVTVAIGGTLYLPNPTFQGFLKAKTKQLVGEDFEVKFSDTDDDGSKGAALTVAVSSPGILRGVESTV